MNASLKTIAACAISSIVLLTLSAPSHGQTRNDKPTHRDVAYDDDHASQCLDVYLAESDKPTPAMIYIHGGGWRAGSKKNIPAWLRKFVVDGDISVVSVEYRFTNVAPHPAQVNDCLRAIQFVRQNATKWNIDTKRLGVTGGSAGGHLSAYVALHDDAADAKSDDPVKQHSSRVACAVSFAGPTDWTLLSTIDHRHPAYRQLIGHPPIMQVHGDKDVIVPVEHARNLHKQLGKIGVISELVVIPGGNHSEAGARNSERATAFVKQYLLSVHP